MVCLLRVWRSCSPTRGAVRIGDRRCQVSHHTFAVRRNPRRRLDRLDDPIRFNRSDIASFNQIGRSTPGSLYLTDGRYLLSVVRLFGRTGKVKVMRYDPETEVWQ